MKRFLFIFLIFISLFIFGCKNEEGGNKNENDKEMVSITLVGVQSEDIEISVEKGSTYALDTPSKTGYTFIGWKDVSTGTFVDKNHIYEEDTFLEAIWERKVMHIVYYKYGNVLLKEDKYYEGDDYEIYTPALEGYTFDAWYLDEALTKKTKITENTATSIYVYAKFTPNVYAVSFDKSDKLIYVTYNNKIGALPKITISGCAFEGWMYNGKKIDANTIYTYSSDIKLTAILKTRSTFDVDGVQKAVNYYIGDNIPYTNVIKNGYIFAGWYETSDFSTDAIYIIDSEKYASKTLYAKFVSSDDSENTYSSKLVDMVSSYYEELYNNKVLYENITMPKDDIYYGCALSWDIDNTSALNLSGVVNRIKTDQEVNITLTISFLNVSKEVKLKVTVKANPYKDIVNEKIVSAYVYTGTFNARPVDDILLNTVDIINFSFVEPNPDGTITVPQDYVTKLNKFKDAAFDKGVRIIMTVSGTHDNATDLATIAASDELRTTFTASILENIKKYGFAGVDIDWEYPTDNGTKFTALMADIYASVKEYDKELLVTSAIPAGPFSFSKYGLKNSNQYLDLVNLMSYDMGCEQMLHHAALYKSSMTYSGCSVEESVNNFKNLGVPLNKIIIGAAFYGRKSEVTSFNYSSANGTASGNVNKNGTVGASITYQSIYNLYLKDNKNAKVYWDTVAKASYIYDSSSKTFITYESEKSLEEKCKYVVSKDVKGIMWWDYGSDSTGTLITALNSYLSILGK